MKNLNHINLLKVYSKINYTGEYGIVLEYCPDGDLKKLIQKKANEINKKLSNVSDLGIKQISDDTKLKLDLKK